MSVITPVLNGAETIEACLQSVARQDYEDVEHIVVDGVSTDGTLELLKSHPVSVISEQDTGIYDAMNKGIAHASGEIIHILNADDRYRHEDVIGRMVSFMVQDRFDLVHARVEQRDANGRRYRTIGQEVSFGRLLRKCRVAHPSVFVRREVYREFGVFDTAFEIAGDHEFLLRVWRDLRIGFVPEVTVEMLLGGRSNTEVRNSYQESMKAALRHGMPPVTALFNYHYEVMKSQVLRLRPRLPRPARSRRTEAP